MIPGFCIENVLVGWYVAIILAKIALNVFSDVKMNTVSKDTAPQ